MNMNDAAEAAERAAPALNGMSGFDFAWAIVWYFAILAIIIIGFILFRKYMLGRLGGLKNGSNMKIRDRLVIAQDKQIILLEIKDKVFMVGISPQSMSTLGEFEKDMIYDGDAGVTDDSIGSIKKDGSFFNILSEKIKTGFDNFDRNKKD